MKITKKGTKKFTKEEKLSILKEEALTKIQAMYLHERHCREQNMTDVERFHYRVEKLVPLMLDFKKWADAKIYNTTPSSPIGKAFAYTIRQWDKLLAVCYDGRLEIDNNLIENKIRPLALGRKNYLFAGSHNAAQRAAMMYTFFATCKANGLNPQQWLTETLGQIGDTKFSELERLIPGWNSLEK